ncbi:toll/interleukin-1 receptor domain-containing protein [Frankia sp. AgKG'84/4]|uniref:toll/interleukin-1 receptor domain-containing protein n=1 Tax=Frankia sp. AgKG'84/4 TaxID=573490 RepID=UPI002010177B|nr:TIR domain-containing protein [Frankia sp. AgKG'84/4]MCL9793491.1 TIR domain-containing protein [Frankia sp. AgKG'84/4]
MVYEAAESILARRDFFVSYVAADSDWAEWIAWQLEAAGYRVTLRAWDLTPGANRERYLLDALENSDRVIAVLSDSYLGSPHRLQELLAAVARDPAGQTRRVILARVDEASPPAVLRGLEPIRLQGLAEEFASEHLLRRVGSAVEGRAKPPTAPAFPGRATSDGAPSSAPASAGPSPVRPSPVRPSSVRPSSVRPSSVEPSAAQPSSAEPVSLVRGGGRRSWGRGAPRPVSVLAHAGPVERAGRTLWVGALAFTGDAPLMVTGADDGRVRLWDLRDRAAPRRVAAFHDHQGWVRGLSVDSHRGVLASGGADGIIVLRDTRRPTVTAALGRVPSGAQRVWATALRPGGDWLAAGGTAGSLRVWDVATPAESRLIMDLPGHRGSVGAVLFASRRTLISAGQHATLLHWALGPAGAGGRADGGVRPPRSLPMAGHDADVWALACTRRRALLASGSDDTTISLWRLAREPAAPVHLSRLDAHRGRIRAMAFSPDGTLLASGGDDNRVRLWDVRHPDLPRLAGTLTRFGGRVASLAFSPRGDLLAAGSADSRLRVYRMAP